MECEAKELKHILGVVVRIHGEVLVSEHLVSAGKVCAECFKCMIIMSEVITELGWILTVRIIWTPNLEKNILMHLVSFSVSLPCVSCSALFLWDLLWAAEPCQPIRDQNLFDSTNHNWVSTLTLRSGSSTRDLVRFSLSLTVWKPIKLELFVSTNQRLVFLSVNQSEATLMDWNGKRGQSLLRNSGDQQ